MQKTMTRRFALTLMGATALTAVCGLAGCGKETTEEGASADRADADIAWQYMTADELVEKLENGDPVIVLDSRPDDMYSAGHIPGAYHVPCFPVDTEEAEQMLVDASENLGGDAPIAIVCKTGNKGAKRAISVLIDAGIAEERLFILEGGGEGWTSEEWTTTENDSTVPTVA